MLIEQVKADRIAAMKARNTVAKTVLTTLLGELEGAAKRNQTDITDDMIIKTCKKFIESNKEVMELNARNSRNLAQENEYLETYIPKQLNEAELRAIIGDISAVNLGDIMKQLKSAYDGQYDGKMASAIAREVLA
jgi:uncharacterized protein YqeY